MSWIVTHTNHDVQRHHNHISLSRIVGCKSSSTSKNYIRMTIPMNISMNIRQKIPHRWFMLGVNSHRNWKVSTGSRLSFSCRNRGENPTSVLVYPMGSVPFIAPHRLHRLPVASTHGATAPRRHGAVGGRCELRWITCGLRWVSNGS